MSDIRHRKAHGGSFSEHGTTGKSTEDRTKMYMNSMAESVPALKPYITNAIPYVVKTVTCFEALVPLFHTAYEKIVEVLVLIEPYRLDLLVPSLIGLIMCFFGGSFMTLIAAVEAYRMIGWDHQVKLIKVLREDLRALQAANAADDKQDLDNDGVADVQQISSRELAQRKTVMFFKAIDPKQLGDCVTGIQAGLMAVIATLKLEYAKAVTLGSAIGHVLEKPSETYVLPVLESMLPPDHKRWASPAMGYVIKCITISFAWFMQRIISAFHSAIRGGTMFSRNILEYLDRMNWVHIRADDTQLDEIVGYIVAALGLWFQLSSGFSLPFPLNLILLPASLAEWFLMWLVNAK